MEKLWHKNFDFELSLWIWWYQAQGVVKITNSSSQKGGNAYKSKLDYFFNNVVGISANCATLCITLWINTYCYNCSFCYILIKQRRFNVTVNFWLLFFVFTLNFINRIIQTFSIYRRSTILHFLSILILLLPV